MPIPKYDEITLPLLKIMSDGRDYSRRELPEFVGEYFKLTDEEKTAKLPSGQTTYLKNRTGWAAFHLRKAGLIDFASVAFEGLSNSRITKSGLDFLKTNPPKVTRTVLMQFEPFKAYIQQLKRLKSTGEEAPGADKHTEKDLAEDETTPEETIDNSYTLLRAQLASELLQKVKAATPTFFEQLVVDLLLKMGYGGYRPEAGRATKPTGDNGIDGIIDEDRLGLDSVYVQAKRWESSVGEPQLRDFVGALHAHRARKGVFMTTSDFSDPARRYVEKVDFKISLIDGRKLTELMIDFGVGVSVVHSYEIKKVDNDYFTEE
ncbi:MAG: restriction endonuclease [Chthoniobacteraceae bacterium]